MQQDARDTSKDANAMSDWISVEDRLPETYGKYLVYFNAQLGYKGVSAIDYCLHWICNNEFVEVTHWMYLPEPPE